MFSGGMEQVTGRDIKDLNVAMFFHPIGVRVNNRSICSRVFSFQSIWDVVCNAAGLEE